MMKNSRLKRSLDQLENNLKDWVSHLVITEKNHKISKVRIKTANVLIPTLEETSKQASGKNLFAVLDLKDWMKNPAIFALFLNLYFLKIFTI